MSRLFRAKENFRPWESDAGETSSIDWDAVAVRSAPALEPVEERHPLRPSIIASLITSTSRQQASVPDLIASVDQERRSSPPILLSKHRQDERAVAVDDSQKFAVTGLANSHMSPDQKQKPAVQGFPIKEQPCRPSSSYWSKIMNAKLTSDQLTPAERQVEGREGESLDE